MKALKIYYLIFSLLIACPFVLKAEKAGQERLDSLLQQYYTNNSQVDTANAKMQMLIAQEYSFINPLKGLEFANRAVKIFENYRNNSELAEAYYLLGLCYFQNNKYADALECLYRSLKENEICPNEKISGLNFTLIGNNSNI